MKIAKGLMGLIPILGILVVIGLFIWLFVHCCSSSYNEGPKPIPVEAEVLTINENILYGELIGHFLGSSSGELKSDVIKIGVKFDIDGKTYLRDIKLNHAQLAYYKDNKTIPLLVVIGRYYLTIRLELNGDQVYYDWK